MQSENLLPKKVDANSNSEQISVELSSRRTGDVIPAHANERGPDTDVRDSHLAVLDRVRIHDFPGFPKAARQPGVLKSGSSPRNFGETLVCLGIGMLVVGIGYHIVFMVGLRRERAMLKQAGLIHAESQYPASLTLTVAVLLLVGRNIRHRRR